MSHLDKIREQTIIRLNEDIERLNQETLALSDELKECKQQLKITTTLAESLATQNGTAESEIKRLRGIIEKIKTLSHKSHLFELLEYIKSLEGVQEWEVIAEDTIEEDGWIVESRLSRRREGMQE